MKKFFAMLPMVYKTRQKAQIAAFLSVFTVLGCGDEKLKKLMQFFDAPASSLKVIVNFQTPDPNLKKPLKYNFLILDRSGSNILPPDPSDPTLEYRFSALENFLDRQSQDPTTYYSLITFASAPKLVATPTNDLSAFKIAVANEKATGVDNGWTNYIDAIRMVKNIILGILEAAQATPSQYVISIAFLTDGYPEIGPGQFQSEANIKSEIGSLMSFEQTFRQLIRSIRFHTGYYYTAVNQSARDLLAQMAFVGKGDPNEPYEFPAGQSIRYESFTAADEKLRFVLRAATVTNESVNWYSDKTGVHLGFDGDRDGLADALEIRLGSNPDLKDTDGDKISDFVEFVKSGTPLAGNFPECDALLNKRDLDLDHDGLTTCEEKLLGSLSATHTSNGIFLDPLALIAGLPFVAGTEAEATKDYDFDGENSLSELRKKLPPFHDNSQIQDLVVQKYQLNVVGEDLFTTSYELTVDPVAAIGPEDNWIAVYLQYGFSIADEHETLSIARKKASPGATVIFNNEDFQ